MSPSACVIGHVTRDVNRVDGSVVAEAPGGVVVYGGLAYRGLGLATTVVTKAAPAEAEALLRPLRDAGIEVRSFDGGATTRFENDYQGADLSARKQTVRAVAAPFAPAELDGVAAGIIHLGPLTAAEMSAEFVSAAARCGEWSVLDAQGLVRKIEGERVVEIARADLDEALSHVDILKTNLDEARALSNESDAEMAARNLAMRGPREVIVTLGADGALICSTGRIERIAAVAPREVVDPTGCGDSFAAGYAHGRVHGLDTASAGRFAAALATSNLECRGALAGGADGVWSRYAAEGVPSPRC